MSGTASRRKAAQRSLRQAQTVIPYGVGAVFDINGESFVAADTSGWRGATPVQSERLAGLLGDVDLVAAPTDDTDNPFASGVGVPYVRFPTWLFCKSCRRMSRWNSGMEEIGKVPACTKCARKPQLVPMRVVQACAAGHLDDIDWVWFAHLAQPGAERTCDIRTELRFETVTTASSTGLDSLLVRCGACGSARSLAGITARRALEDLKFSCNGAHPWARGSAEHCDQAVRAVQRGASNLYYPTMWTSIEVPSDDEDVSESDAAAIVKASTRYKAISQLIEQGDSLEDPVINSLVTRLATELSMSKDFVLGVLRGTTASAMTAISGQSDLLTGEWAALQAPAGLHTEDFVSRRVSLLPSTDRKGPIATIAEGLIESVVLIDKLREVRVLEGFHRLEPGPSSTFVRADGKRSHSPKTSTRLPAAEVFGEGILLVLNEDRLVAWEGLTSVRQRTAMLHDNLMGSPLRGFLEKSTGPALTSRFLLLHSLGHLLMRRLAFESGYGVTSLRERVYARSTQDGSPEMSGILIYTAAGDSEGTMGGLVRAGEPPDLLRLILETLTEASWCASDPLCSEQTCAGTDSLSHAACHACSYASETSCECANRLLDRLCVVGSGDAVGYFDDLVHAAEKESAALVRS